MKTLEDLFHHELKDLYSAEKQLTEALPKMAEAASSPSLKQAFQNHLAETESQLQRVRQILDELDVNPGNKKCKAMEGLIEEGQDMIKEKAEASVKDAGLIASAQRVEHYEIAGYGTASYYAEILGHTQIAKVLEDILAEEKAADQKLNRIAKEKVNQKAKK